MILLSYFDVSYTNFQKILCNIGISKLIF